MRVTLTLTAVLLIAAASSAWADGPIATAAQSPAAQPPAPVPPPLDLDQGDAADHPDIVPGPCGPTKAKADGSPNSDAHGEVEVGVGTNGYRHLAGTVCKPIGDSGVVSVSVGESQGDWGRRR
jgi:hypothetical protein